MQLCYVDHSIAFLYCSSIHCILPKSAQLCDLLKFILLSPRDGTSIILSDDVGQLYILSTGQGESQKDAKYDQVHMLLW